MPTLSSITSGDFGNSPLAKADTARGVADIRTAQADSLELANAAARQQAAEEADVTSILTGMGGGQAGAGAPSGAPAGPPISGPPAAGQEQQGPPESSFGVPTAGGLVTNGDVNLDDGQIGQLMATATGREAMEDIYDLQTKQITAARQQYDDDALIMNSLMGIEDYADQSKSIRNHLTDAYAEGDKRRIKALEEIWGMDKDDRDVALAHEMSKAEGIEKTLDRKMEEAQLSVDKMNAEAYKQNAATNAVGAQTDIKNANLRENEYQQDLTEYANAPSRELATGISTKALEDNVAIEDSMGVLTHMRQLLTARDPETGELSAGFRAYLTQKAGFLHPSLGNIVSEIGQTGSATDLAQFDALANQLVLLRLQEQQRPSDLDLKTIEATVARSLTIGDGAAKRIIDDSIRHMTERLDMNHNVISAINSGDADAGRKAVNMALTQSQGAVTRSKVQDKLNAVRERDDLTIDEKEAMINNVLTALKERNMDVSRYY